MRYFMLEWAALQERVCVDRAVFLHWSGRDVLRGRVHRLLLFNGSR